MKINPIAPCPLAIWYSWSWPFHGSSSHDFTKWHSKSNSP